MASEFFEVPLLPSVNQTFRMVLGSNVYRLAVHWAEICAQCWLLDIADQDGNALINGIPLLPGADLLGQYKYIGIGGELWVLTDAFPSEPPTFDNLGVGAHLYFVTGDSPNWSFT